MVLVIRNMKQRKRSMRKQGPCCHCGVKETPLWRNGPPEKPVLCNACGSRWRIRGNLDAYVPNNKRGTVVHRGKKRSRKIYNPFKWIENEDDEEEEEEEEEEDSNEDESDEEWRGTRQKTRHSDSISESMTSEEPGKLYEVPVVMQSEIIISDDDEKDGSSDDSRVVAVEETKVQDNYAWVDQSDDGDDDDEQEDPLAHIKMLQRELYQIFKNEKSSSSSSSSCSSLAESPVEDEVLLYNVSNPRFSENEIGFGSFLLKAP